MTGGNDERVRPDPDELGPESPSRGERAQALAKAEANRRWAKVAGGSLLAAVVLAIVGAALITPDCEGEGCPSVDRLGSYRPPEPPQIYDASGELAGQLSGPRRTVVELEAIPEIIRDGYVAVEDRRFWEHGGVDWKGGFRALMANLKSGGIAEGASTITMQLARNVFGPEVLDWNQFRRKLAEIRLAHEIEDQLSKEQILALYLNQIYLGDGVYGVETAARHYFGKSVSEVGTREAALLIGLAKNPEGYNPRRDPFAAKDRIEVVLDLMLQEGVIDEEAAEKARADRVRLVEGARAQEWGKNAYFLSGVRRELRGIVPDPVQRQGLRVHTGLDQRAQAAAVDALVAQIRGIEGGRWGRFRAEAAGDLSRQEGSASPYLQGMVVAMDPETGLVTTLVGGRDYDHSEFDRAFQAKRQPGSAFKPIVYATALQQGVRLTERVSTEPVRMARQGMQDWEPSDAHITASEMSVRDALVFSSNSATVRVGERLGPARVARQAQAMGITADIPHYPSIYLGAAEMVPAELVAAYALFTNGGHTITPHLITRIEDPHGHVIYRRPPERGNRVLDPSIAFLVLDMMRDVVRRGTGRRVTSGGFSYPVAGKTGTTNDSRDVWFVGMTPRLVAGVWLGFDEPKTIVPGAGGGDLAAPVWSRFMEVANRNLKPMPAWRPPPGVVEVQIDPHTGYRIVDGCPFVEVRTEYFIQGTEPSERCPFRDFYGEHWYLDSLRRERDTMNARYDTSRTIFYPGIDVEEEEEEEEEELEELRERLRRERERRLDSLDALRRTRPGAMAPIVIPDTTTLGRPDSIRRDTVQGPRGTGEGAR